MAKIIVIYVGQTSANNLTHGIQNGIWGFKKSVAQDLIEIFVYDDESYFIIGSVLLEVLLEFYRMSGM